jgi:hypothetical protein
MLVYSLLGNSGIPIMLTLETRAHLDTLHTGLMKESLTLEYKSSGAVDKSEPKKHEMAKDALAFANAAGGQIIYGMQEKDNLPLGLDAGIDPNQFPGIWFEQVIQQNVAPQIEGLRVHEVPLDDGTGRVAVVVTIPAAQGRAPHQAKDGRYYRRHNFGNQIMNDSEVRDTMRRATTPELYIRLSLPRGDNAGIEFAHGSEMSKPVTLSAFIGNRSSQPAFHSLVRLGIDSSIAILTNGLFTPEGERTEPGMPPQTWLMRRVSTPPELPIFKEVESDITRSSVTLGFKSKLCGGDTLHHFRVTIVIQTPGYASTEHWVIRHRGEHLELLKPGHPLTR